ncbi:MAG: DUF1566 domain-containing protein [Burkholderiales bacterium]
MKPVHRRLPSNRGDARQPWADRLPHRRGNAAGRCLGCLLLALTACGPTGDEAVASTTTPTAGATAWRVPGTAQEGCFSNDARIDCPSAGAPFFGQDGQRPGPRPPFHVNTDGTVTDPVTGLTWTRALAGPMSWDEARAAATALRTGGYNDWRVPGIKELYTLIDFRGWFAPTAAQSRPFIDAGAFEFAYAEGSRFFDVQLWSSTGYVATTMNDDATIFGVNFADGRIKGYPRYQPGRGGVVPQRMRVRFVRGPAYGVNDYREDSDGTVTDRGSGLTWQQSDDGHPRRWRDALAYCAALRLADHADWRLPDAKELHSIVDYTRAPATAHSAALAPPLRARATESYYWTSTTVLDGPPEVMYARAAYFAFGRALGWMEMPPGSGIRRLLDVHGAGSQRVDPKDGDPATYPRGFGPQGDDVRILNYVRCVRGHR